MTNKLDLYDYKILNELEIDARKPASEIAKKVRLSKVAVGQRIERLQSKGIIKNFMTQVDYRKLGFDTYRIYFKLQNIPAKTEEEFYIYLKQDQKIGYVARIDGDYDIFSVAITRNHDELYTVLSEINKRFGKYIKERNILFVIGIKYYGRRYLHTTKEAGEKIEKILIREQSDEVISLDDTDHKILQLLSQDARLPVIELASRLGITKDVAHYRIKRLMNAEILQKFTINIDHEKFGKSFYKVLMTLNYDADEKNIVSRLSEYQNMIRVIRVLGSWSIELDFEVNDNIEMRTILKDIKERFGEHIQDIEALFLYRIDKLNYYPF